MFEQILIEQISDSIYSTRNSKINIIQIFSWIITSLTNENEDMPKNSSKQFFTQHINT